jgi:hypothetical protein
MSENLNPYTPTKGADGAVGWNAFTPVFRSNGSNPSLGTGGTIVGRYRQQSDKSVQGTVNIVFGTSPSAGTGTYLIDFPVAPSLALTYAVVGSYYAYHNPTFSTGAAIFGSSTQLQLLSAANALVGAASPWVWAAGDVLVVRFAYEAA